MKKLFPYSRFIALPTRLAIILAGSVTVAFAVDYHVDSGAGNDSGAGTSPTTAWRSLERVNREGFQPGDRILFRAGTRHTGQLRPSGSGTAEAPIRIGRYGDGTLPRIDGEGAVLDTLLLRNVEFWEVEDLEITNLGPERAPWRTGVRIVAEVFGRMRHIRLRRLFVHDVNGDLRKSHEGCGIYFETLGRQTRSFFDGLLVENCHLLRVDRNGICQRNGSGPHSVGVVIRKNRLEDIGGDGIKPWGSDAPLVEHNVVRGGRMRCDDAAAGIWPFDCNDALIQFNEVSGVRGVIDGQSFDSDFLCRRTVIQYNYSHDNEGGFLLVCTPGDSFNDGTIIRYNISRNDGIGTARVFHFGGGSTNTLIYNNTIYVGAHQELPMMIFSEWNRGVPDGVKFFNNLFYVDGRVSYDLGPARNVVFSHNIVYGEHAKLPPGEAMVTTRPPLKNPRGGGDGFASLEAFRPEPGSDFPRGQIVPNNGGRDFFGDPVPADAPPFIGAIQGR